MQVSPAKQAGTLPGTIPYNTTGVLEAQNMRSESALLVALSVLLAIPRE